MEKQVETYGRQHRFGATPADEQKLNRCALFSFCTRFKLTNKTIGAAPSRGPLAVMKNLMQILFFLLVVWILSSCSNDSKPNLSATSYWAKLKDSFATKNLESFVVDSQLQTNYKSFHQIKYRSVDSAISYGTPYLYSWQERNSGLAEFTILVDDEDHGTRVIYFIFDQNDSLRSATEVAGKGGEGGIIYETRSHFISKDSLLKTTAATTKWDLDKPAPPPRLPKPKGDSSLFYLTILKDGAVREKQFAEKRN